MSYNFREPDNDFVFCNAKYSKHEMYCQREEGHTGFHEHTSAQTGATLSWKFQ